MAEFNRQKLLLTGASGFVGGFVQQAANSVPLMVNNKDVDLRNLRETQEAIAHIRPDAVLHLAAQTFVPRSFDDPLETFEINFLGTYNLLVALKKIGFAGRFLLVSTGDVYGSVAPELLPVTEEMLPRPRNPYAVSKVAAEALCFQWNETAGFETMVARPFNHIGPGQREDFVISGFAKQIAEIKHGAKAAIIETGDLEVTRDFCDVRDVVQAYLLLLLKGRAGETYNICSGKECSIRSLLNKMLELAAVEAEIKSNPTKFRPSEQRRMFGDAGKIRRHVGWQPSRSIEQTLADTIHSWEYQIA
ncbi:MAG TPA: GDP-mannose 4,6-dehydratase [Terriglobales bacterium]|nr:GDP-mannose 4,6-dehydratase [Terriglobales bacterium]